jgi:hypothetical protein
MRGVEAASIPLPVRFPLDAASGEQTPLVVRQEVVHLLAVIRNRPCRSPRSTRACGSDLSMSIVPRRRSAIREADRSLWRAGYPGHCQALVAPMKVIEAKPQAYFCGQTEVPDTRPSYTPGHRAVRDPDDGAPSLPGDPPAPPAGWRARHGCAGKLAGATPMVSLAGP